jgi:hypothetical protein
MVGGEMPTIQELESKLRNVHAQQAANRRMYEEADAIHWEPGIQEEMEQLNRSYEMQCADERTLLRQIELARQEALSTSEEIACPDTEVACPKPQVEIPDFLKPLVEEYKGDLVDGVRHGHGTCLYPSSLIYVGDWVNGEWHGNGTLAKYGTHYPYLDYSYKGEFRNGSPSGEGRLFWSTWSDDAEESHPQTYVREGCFKYFSLHGKGKSTSSEGVVEEGEFQSGQLHGKGKITFDDNYFLHLLNKTGIDASRTPLVKAYEGDFERGKYHGKGKAIHTNGEVYEGEFRNGKRHGFGKTYFIDGTVVEGEWQDGMPSGYGKWMDGFGSVYEGMWQQGRLHGKGRIIYNKKFYEEYRPIGKGKMKAVYEGEFVNGSYHGHGKLTYTDGTVEEGEWNSGVNRERIEAEKRAAQERKAHVKRERKHAERAEAERRQSESWRSQGLCVHCGGQLGFFKKCKTCGEKN